MAKVILNGAVYENAEAEIVNGMRLTGTDDHGLAKFEMAQLYLNLNGQKLELVREIGYTIAEENDDLVLTYNGPIVKAE